MMWPSEVCSQYAQQAREQFITHAPQVAFLTGAGASKALGLPVMNQFFEHLVGPDVVERVRTVARVRSDMMISLIRAAYPDPSTEVFDLERVMMLIQVLETGLFKAPDDLFDSILSLTFASLQDQQLNYKNWATQVQGWQPGIAVTREAITQAKDEIVREFHSIFGSVDPEQAFRLWQPLLSWAKGQSLHPVPIFTTNYDIAIEQAAETEAFESSFSLQTGFAPVRQAHTWRPAHYSAGKAGTFWLLKLHGSSNWCISKSSGELLLQPESRPICPDSAYYIPAIRLPYESKGVPSADIEPVYHVQYEALEAALSVAKFFVVIGLSFRDDTLRQYFHETLSRRPDLHVAAVAPVGDAHTEKFLNYGLTELSQHPNFHRLNLRFGEDHTAKLIEQLDVVAAQAGIGDVEKSA
ncbi:MAG: SIR2 family protein [Armatimonadota bacterium]